MVKIDLGTHIDGYIALSAHTVVVGHVPNPSAPVTGPRANVIHAAWTAANVAAKLIRPGNTNAQVTEAIKKITEAYGVKAIVGGIIHQMKRYVIEVTTKQAILRDDIPDHKVDACTFEPYEVYALDIAMSSGKGMPICSLICVCHKLNASRVSNFAHIMEYPILFLNNYLR